MDKLVKALAEMKEILEKGLAPATPSKIPALPSIQTPPVPSMKAKVPKKMPGIKPASTKDPKKVAQQIKEGNPQQAKVPMLKYDIIKDMDEFLKFDKNGQWSLEKSVFNAGTHPPKGYVPGQKKLKDTHAEYDPKYSFKDNRELVRMHHQDHKIPVRDEAHLDSLTRAAAKRGGHTIKE